MLSCETRSTDGCTTHRDIVVCPVGNGSSVWNVSGIPLKSLGKLQDQDPHKQKAKAHSAT